MVDPEELSGLWEAPDGHGGAVGIQLQLTTIVPPGITTLLGAKQSWEGLVVGLYQRTAAASEPFVENGFSDSPESAGVHYDDGHLTLHYQDYDLDLRRVAEGWSGRFHREKFDSVVTLRRPGSDIKGDKPWIVGTWMTMNLNRGTCLHVVQQAPGAFLAWSDSLDTMASTHAASDLNLPSYATELYGKLATVDVATDGAASVVLNAYTGICCPHPFRATSVQNKGLMIVDWLAAPNQSPRHEIWAKVAGDSCLVSAP